MFSTQHPYLKWNSHFHIMPVLPLWETIYTSPHRTSDSSLKNSWAAYGPGNANRLEISVIDYNIISKNSSGLKDPSLIKSGANEWISPKYSRKILYWLRVRHVVDIYIHIDIIPDVLDTSGESKNNIGPPSGGPKKKLQYHVIGFQQIINPCIMWSIIENMYTVFFRINLHPLYEHIIHYFPCIKFLQRKI